MHRCFIEPAQSREPVLHLSDREAYHATKVLRVREGEKIVCLDGAGTELACTVESIQKDRVSLRVMHRTTIQPLPYQLTLFQAIPKGKNMELIVQKATELGAFRVVPILAERSIPHIEEENAETKLEKWNHIAIDSIKQCGSAWLPKIERPAKTSDVLAAAERFDISLLATLQSDAKHPRHYFEDFKREKNRKPKSIAVWVGPEGDFTPAEINPIRAAHASPITLGPLILRSETAAIYCLSAIGYEMQWQG